MILLILLWIVENSKTSKIENSWNLRGNMLIYVLLTQLIILLTYVGVLSNGKIEVSKTFDEGSIPSTPANYTV